jgi:hypothetical protein
MSRSDPVLELSVTLLLNITSFALFTSQGSQLPTPGVSLREFLPRRGTSRRTTERIDLCSGEGYLSGIYN